MAITRKLPDGRTVVLGDQGWRVLTPEEQAAADTSHGAAWGMQLLNNAATYAGMAGTALSRGQGMGTPIGQPLTQWADRTSQDLAPLDQFQPGASAAGRIWTDPFNVAAAVGVGGKIVRGAMASRVQAKIAQNGARAASGVESAATPNPAAAASNLDQYGIPQSTVGSAAAGTGSKQTLVERLTQEFNASVRLTDQQKAAAQAIKSGGVNFQALPGQIEGSRLMNSGIKSNPVWLAEFEGEMVANYRELTNRLKVGMGLPEGVPFTDEVTSLADDVLGANYNKVRDMVTGDIKLSPEVAKVAEPAMTPFEKGLIDLGKPLPAEQIFQLRSDLSAMTRKLAKDGDITGLRATYQAIEEIDKSLLPHLGEEGKALFQETNARWRLKLVVDSANAVSPSGQINLASINRAGRTIFRKQWRGFGPRAGLPEEVSRAIDQIKVSAAFPDAVGNSGTAERLTSMDILRSPKKYATDRAIGKALRWIADRNIPEPAP